MIKHFLYIICTVLPFFNLWAQPYITLSESLESANTDRTYHLIHYDSTSYAVMRIDKAFRYAETELFDAKLKYLKTFVSTPDKRYYAGAINLEGRLHLLYSRFKINKELERTEDVSFWAIPMSRDSFYAAGDSIALVEPFVMYSPKYKGNYVLSPDRGKVLVYHYEEDGDIEEVEGLTNEITLRVFDNKFKLLWVRKVNLAPNPSGKRVMSIKKLRVSNKGEVSILTDYFRNHRSYNLKEVTADPTLFFVGEDPANFARLTPNLGNLYYNQIDFMYDQDGNIIWFGFYSNQKYHQQAGYFYIKINSDRTKILSKKICPFSEELLKQLLNTKKLPKIPEVRNFEMLYFKMNAEGDLVISTEFQPYGVSNFKSHNLLVLRIDPKGDLRWAKHIYKYNIFPYNLKVFLQHYMQIDGNNVYLIYNQGIYAEDGKAIAICIDEKGEISEKTIFGYLAQENVICPSLCTPLPDGRCFLSLQSRFFKYHQSGILDFRKLFK